MNGLRELRRFSGIPLGFCAPPPEGFDAICVTPTPENGCAVQSVCLQQHDLGDFLDHGLRDEDGELPATAPTLTLIRVSMNQNSFNMDKSVFFELLERMGLDPWVEHLIAIRSHGFLHSGTPTSPGGASYFFGNVASAIWTTRRDESGSYSTKCLLLDPTHQYFDPLDGVREHVTAFREESPSALYLPFVLAINTLRRRENIMLNGLKVIQEVEEKTGHGSWGTGRFEEKPDSITEHTASLGSALNAVGSTAKHLKIIQTVFDHLEFISTDEPSDKSILSATEVVRQQVLTTQLDNEYLELRIRNQSSVLFAFLTHEDSNINIDVAKASRELAEAARRDGSSMKTIAVLTMAFLPATFLAALFSMPSMAWDQPDKFVLYWACVIPITIATFAFWAGITQRQQISEILRPKRKDFNEDEKSRPGSSVA